MQYAETYPDRLPYFCKYRGFSIYDKKKIGPEKNSLMKPITSMNCMYCLQTMSFQPKNEIKHPHP